MYFGNKKNLGYALFFALATPVLASFSPADSAKAADKCGGAFIGNTVSGKNLGKARDEAKAEIARSIISDVKANTKTTSYGEEVNGVFKESSNFLETSEIETKLRLYGVKEIETPKLQKNGEYELKTYICVKDAANGFLEQQRLVADSLGFASTSVLSTKHPKQKNEAWQRTRTLWNEFMKIQILLDVLEVESLYLTKSKGIYSKTIADYKNYCRNTKVFWQDAGNECSGTVFSMLSNKIKMEKSQCSASGLKLNLNCSETCSSSFGLEVECSVSPSLAIESCGGEKYRTLTNEPVKGSHQHNKSIAKKDMIDNLSRADFFNKWEAEILGWVPQCEE